MIGKPENKICPTCGGKMVLKTANIPFIFGETVIVVKEVPAEVCQSCHEPFVDSATTAHLMPLLKQFKNLHSEVSVITYTEPALA